MLVNLHVKNLALIEEAEVDFSEHLNILTGETGAGKSILIGSIQSALGSKIPRDMIRNGCDSASIELLFYTKSKAVRGKLKEYEIPWEDGEVVLARRVTSSRVINKINGVTVTAARLKEIAPYLLDLSGQHDNQLLLSPQNHLRILDSYAGKAAAQEKEKIARLYREYHELKKEYESKNMKKEERLREIEFLKYEIAEIKEAALRPGEDEELEALFYKISHAKDILAACAKTYQYTAGDGAASAQSLLGLACRSFGEAAAHDGAAEELAEQLATVDALLNDFNRDLSGYMSSLEFDEETYAQTAARLDLINRLKEKHGGSIESVQARLAESEERLAQLADYDGYLARLRDKTELTRKKLAAECNALHTIRKQTGAVLSEKIRNALLELNFLDVRFETKLTMLDHFTAEGQDAACFMISLNPGQPLKPLHETASGGELSRIMLAVKTVLADEEGIETLIFDEIDAGISGRTAQKVSERLAELAKKRQVIAITHLPQIAAMAESHFLIEKTSDATSTVSRIVPLTEEESVEELARMLGGAEITEAVLENAREMKKLAAQISTGEV